MESGFKAEKPFTSKRGDKKTETKNIAPGKKMPDVNVMKDVDRVKKPEDEDLSDVQTQDPNSGDEADALGGFREGLQNMWNAIKLAWRYVGDRVGMPVQNPTPFEDDPDKDKAAVEMEDDEDMDVEDDIDIDEQLERPEEQGTFNVKLVMNRAGVFF